MSRPRLYKLKDILPQHVRVIDQHSVYMPHSIYTKKQLSTFQNTHRKPETLSDKLAYYGIDTARWMYDKVTGYDHD